VPDPRVSIVVQLSAGADEAVAGLPAMLTSLLDQDFSTDAVEIIICQYGLDAAATDAIRQQFPSVAVIDASEDGYYRLKNAGIRAARAAIIALADPDCVYSRGWLRELVAAIDGGADVAVGFSRLQGDSLLRRLCAFYDQHQMLVRTSRRMRRFNSNNVAFRAEVVKTCMYEPRFDRTGGCVQLAEALLRRGARMQFVPEQTNRHAFYGIPRHTWMQALCSGYDFIHTRQVDPAMPLARLTRLPLVGPLTLGLIFVGVDVYNVAQNRRILAIRGYELPAFFGFSLLMRPVEVAGMFWARLRPASAARFVAKNFA
jgi:Glycosyl transferase family 2